MIDGHFASGSGPSMHDAIALGYRFPRGGGFAPDRGESWIVRTQPDSLLLCYGKAGWLTGLWRAPSGAVYVTDYYSELRHHPDPRAGADWNLEPVPAKLMGVWGLREDALFLWGIRQGDPVAFLRTPSGIRELPAPPDRILAMHGVADDAVVAVGQGGMVARWDGHAWVRLATGTRSMLGCVHVASVDEIYAAGIDGDLLSGSIHGIAPLLKIDAPIRAVAKWKGEVWVGSDDPHGLSKLTGATLASVKPNLTAMSLDARGDLVVTTTGHIAGTSDGKAFAAHGIAAFLSALKNDRPMWLG